MIKQLFNEISECHPVLSSRKPLAIGIKDTLKALYPGIRSKDLYRLMSMIAHHDTYLGNCVAGNARYSLSGQTDGEVTAEQAIFAQSVLSQRKQDRKKSPTNRVSAQKIRQAEKAPEKPRFPLLTLRKKAG